MNQQICEQVTSWTCLMEPMVTIMVIIVLSAIWTGLNVWMCVNVIYLLSTVIKHHKAARTLEISPTKLFYSDQTLFLSYPFQYFITF